MPDLPRIGEALAELGQVQDEEDEVDRRRDAIATRLFGSTKPPRRFGRFTELGPVGSGGMGEVFKAYDPMLNRLVAVKLMRKQQRRLLREAQALARLSHPNVVQVYEVGEVDDQPFIAMELVSGETLERWQREPHSWRAILAIYLQAGRGLAAAHDRGLIHRDFKPANCILGDDDRVRVVDFGLARETEVENDDGSRRTSIRLLVSSDLEVTDLESATGSDVGSSGSILRQPLTKAGSVVGTRGYMSPEQLLHRPANAKSDQFSFCVALFEALYGQLPFTKKTLQDLIAMAQGEARAPLVPPAGIRVPRWLIRALWRGLSAAPEDRWPSMNSFLQELERGRRQSWMRRGVLGLAAVGLVMGGAGINSGLRAMSMGVDASPCGESAHQEIERIWNTTQRQRVHDAILNSGRLHAPDTVDRVLDRLDGYVHEWVDASVGLCEAARTPPGTSIEIVDQQRACLHRGWMALGQDVELLANANTKVVDNAVKLLAQLPSVQRCADVSGRIDTPQLQRPPELTEELEALRARVELVRSLELVEKYDEGLDMISSVVARAEELTAESLLAEALQVEGQLLLSMRQNDQAETVLRNAYATALRYGEKEIAADALSSLIYLVGIRRGKTETSLWLGTTAEALIAQEGIGARPAADVLTSVAQVHTERGELDIARKRYEAALDELDHLSGVEILAKATPLDGLAQVSRRQGDSTRAEQLYREALDIRETWLGPHHPVTLAHERANLCSALHDRGEYVKAQGECRQALELLTADEVRVRDHETLAHARGNLGAVLSRIGQQEDAEAMLRRAIEDAQLAYDEAHPRVATYRFNLGRVLQEQGCSPGAIEEYEAALRILRTSDRTQPHAILQADIQRRLGKLLLMQGHPTQAEAHYQEALDVLESSVGLGNPKVASHLNHFGRLLVELGDANRAEPLHLRALVIYEATHNVDPVRIANTLRGLTRARIAQGRWQEVEEHLMRARRIYLDAPEPKHDDRIADTELKLAELHVRQGARADAVWFARKARDRLPAEHPLAKEAEMWLRTHLGR